MQSQEGYLAACVPYAAQAVGGVRLKTVRVGAFTCVQY